MALSQARPNRKQTGSKYKAFRGKRMSELGRSPTFTGLAERKAKSIRTLGGNHKYRLLRSDIVNVMDPKTKKCSKVKIKTVLENPANRHFVRRNIMTKGTVIETEKGKAKITSRPGQDGTINAVLI